MKLSASLIPVKGITSKVPRSTFPEDAIEQSANAILEAEGLINPIVVRQVSLKEFEVVSGHFEYYAAVRAREIDLARGEMIDAIVLTVTTQPETESALMRQIELLRQPNFSASSSPVPVPSQEVTPVEARLTNLEKFLERQFSEWNQKHLEEKRRLDKIVAENKIFREEQANLSKPLKPIELFNHATPQDLKVQFQKIKLTGKTAEAVIQSIEEERQKEPFSSLKDIVNRVKKFGAKRMLALLER